MMRRAMIGLMVLLAVGLGAVVLITRSADDPVEPRWSKTAGGLRCRLTGPGRSFGMNENVELTFVLQNETDGDIHFIWADTGGNPWGNAVPEVRNGWGRRIEFPTMVLAYDGARRSRFRAVTVPASGTWHMPITLSRATARPPFDTGRYTARVHFSARTPEAWAKERLPEFPEYGSSGLPELRKSGTTFWSGELTSSKIWFDIGNSKDDDGRKPKPPRELPLK